MSFNMTAQFRRLQQKESAQFWFNTIVGVFRFEPFFGVLYGAHKIYKLAWLQHVCDQVENLTQSCNNLHKNIPFDSFAAIECCPEKCGNSCVHTSSPLSMESPLGAGIEVLCLTLTGLTCFGLILGFESM